MTRTVGATAALSAALIGIALHAQAPDRSVPPQFGPPPELRLPAIQKSTLSNGLPVWHVELHEVPVVQVDVLVGSGAASDPQDKFGVASLTAAMLDEGAGGRSALEIADAIDYLGAALSTSISFDAAAVALHVPVARLADALPVMADVVLRPAFPLEDLERLRQERLTSLLEARDDPSSIVATAFPRLVYGPTYRYGTPGIGTTATVKALTRDDLRAFYAAHYRPDNAAVVVAGDITSASALPLLESAFGAWRAPDIRLTETALPGAPQLASRHVYLIDKPGAAQSQIRIGWVGVARSTPDYFPLQVLNTLLGGSFTSRLNQNLREAHGYAYGAGSTFDMRRSAGPFFAAAGVQTDKTAEALKEFFVELNGILKPVPAGELARAKNYVALGFPAEFETTGGIAAKLEDMILFNLPDDYFSTYIARIQAVTSSDLQRIAALYIQPARFAVVVVGDRKTVEAPIRALDLGPMTVVSIDEVMGPAAQQQARPRGHPRTPARAES